MGQVRGKKGNDTLVGTNKDDFIYGLGGDDTLWGGLGNDSLIGDIGNDRVFGEGGNDRLWGDAGEDLLDGGDGTDWAYGGDGNDVVRGGVGDDFLQGMRGNDVLEGGSGIDELHGGENSDTLTGGAGADRFTFVRLADSDALNGVDLITDFESGIDVLWMGPEGTDANASLAGLQDWDFVGAAPTGAPLASGNGQATISHADSMTVLNLYNNDGDTVADFTLRLAGIHDQLQILGWVDGSPSGAFTNVLINYPAEVIV